MEIDIHQYLSDEEIREIAISEVRNSFHRQMSSEADVERVLVNLSYEYVFKKVCDHLVENGEDVETRIINGVNKALVDDAVRFQVFRRADAWHRTESPAVKILDDVLSECRPKIEEEVYKRISQYDFRELREEIEDTIYGVICRKLEGK